MAERGYTYRIAGIIVVVAMIACMWVGCDSEGCYENRSSIAQAKFYAYNDPKQAVSADSISVYGIGQKDDALLLDIARNVNSMKLPFRNDADTTQYVIRYETIKPATTAYNDTLTFVYKRYPYFVSGDCGVMFNYTIEHFHYTRNMLDSAALQTPEVTNEDVETLKLFYYVAK